MLANISGIIIYTNNLTYIFIALLPNFQCSNLTDSQLVAYNISYGDNEVEYSQCHISIKPKKYQNVSAEPMILECLNGYNYTTPVDKSIVSQWDLVCQRAGLAELSQTIYILGQLIGSLFMPIQMEYFGRRPIHIICNILILPLNILCAYSPFFWLFTITRFFNGVLIQGYLISTCTVITEMFPASKRNLMTGLSSLIFSFTILIFELTVYLVRYKSWHVLVICCACFSSYGIIEIIFFQESLRWLFAKGKVKKAKDMIQYAAKLNNADYEQTWQIALEQTDILSETECTELVEIHKKNNKHSMSEERMSENKETTKLQPKIDVFEKENQENRKSLKSRWFGIIAIMQYSYTRSISFIIVLNWLAITMTYHSFFILSETLSGDLYLNFLFLCLIEIISCIIYWPTIVRFGHKKPLATASSFGSLCLIIAAILKGFGGESKEINIFFMVFFMLAMLGTGSAFGGLFLYTPELYPTEVRSVGLGLCSASARLGNMMAPFARTLATYSAWAPSVLFGSACIISSILLSWGLPETFKKRLPQTMYELKQIQESQKLRPQEQKA
ncbi:SLC22A4_5 [Acanthosepion pharaonis]|uniref:SLC22A4_5 n=1 Tax=Acanthosepion pharaonis TaxID=158019 RepID=A0A812D022_ACAPH|nr:SLC22A4_5 [Sepia pharaonis]